MVRVGVDIGGTFTDFAAWREGDREVFTTKVPSTPPRFAEAFKTGFGEVLARMRPASGEPVYVMHGTTVSTYSIIERSGPTIALFTTAGFKDILGLERLRLKQPLDLFGTRPQPLIPRHLVFEIDERLNSDGTVRRPWSTVRGILTADLVSPRESQGATLPRFLAMIQSMGVAPPAEWILW